MLKRSEVGKRFCWTIFFVFIYVLGSKISLPFVDLSKALRLNEGTTTGLQLSSAVMGGNLRGMSIFSIGLSPWMSSMILWRMFTVSKRFNLEKTSSEIVERRKMYVTLALHCPVLGSGHVSPLEDRVELRTCHCGQYHDYGSWSLLSSLALRSKCRFGAWKFCGDHDGWDGDVSSRRRDADPFKCQ